MSEYLTVEGLQELNEQEEKLRNTILATAQLLALKEQRRDIDKIHIQIATKKVKILDSSLGRSALYLIDLLLIPIAFIQIASMSSLNVLNKVEFWLLPICCILWASFFAYKLKDIM